MKRRSAFLTCGAVAAGLVIALAVRASDANSPQSEATLAVELTGAECGGELAGSLYLHVLDGRVSRAGEVVGLGAYSVTVQYPAGAFDLQESSAQVPAREAIRTRDGAAERTWIAAPVVRDSRQGSITFGAFSYVGAPNEAARLDGVDVTDDTAAREEGGLLPGGQRLLLGSFNAIARSAGTHAIRVEAELADSSLDVLPYRVDGIEAIVEVGGTQCEPLEAPPAAEPPTVTMPPLTGTIATPRTHPNAIPFVAAQLEQLPDVCAGVARAAVVGADQAICLPEGWRVVDDPGPEAQAQPRPGTPYVALILESERDGKRIARVGVHLSGPEPFSVTQCSEPARTELGIICVHEQNSERDSMLPAGTWRMLGITTEAERYTLIELFDLEDPDAQQSAQRESLAVVRSLVEGGWR